VEQPAVDAPRDAWLVYADALQEAGDPRGMLIVLQDQVASGADPGERDAWIETHRAALDAFVAELRGPLPADRVWVDGWTWAAPSDVSLRVDPSDGVDLVRQLRQTPLAGSIQRLRLVARRGGGPVFDLQPVLRAVRQDPPAPLEALDLVDERAESSRVLVSSDYDPHGNLVAFGPIARAIGPELKGFRIVTADANQVDFSGIEAPALERFELECLRWGHAGWNPGAGLGSTFAEARWPRLRHLALRIPETFTYSWPSTEGAYHPGSRYEEDNEYYDVDTDGWAEDLPWGTELGPLLEALRRTSLERLSLTSFASGRMLLSALAEHGLPDSLRVLDLSDSDLADEHLDVIAGHPEVFGRLQVIDLRGTFVGDASRLDELSARVLVAPGAGHRYQFSVGME